MPLTGTALALSHCELFKDFSETGLAILASIAAGRLLAAGSPLFVEGMASDALFVIKSGRVRLWVKGEGGADQPIGVLEAGEPLGQLALLLPSGTRLVSAIAAEESEVFEIRARDFARLQGRKPQACLKLRLAIATQLGQRIGEGRDLWLAALARSRPPARSQP